MKTRTKVGLILGLAYVIDRIFYPHKYKKKEPELTGELKYTTSTGEVKSEKIKFENTDRLRNESVPKYQYHNEDPEIWMKKQKQISPIVDRAERYCEKAEDCKDTDKAIIYYKQSIDNWSTVVGITHQPSDYRELLSVCWVFDISAS